jgi:ribosomal protein S21
MLDAEELLRPDSHSYYLKPGEKKRIKQALARKRSRKKVRREAVGEQR